MTKTELLKRLDLPDAFAGFTPFKDSVLWGWNGDLPIFGELIQEKKPLLILEVGSWLGQSTATMAKELQTQGLADSCIVAIDTWLGSMEHWSEKHLQPHLGLQNGFPTLYPRFLSNMLNASCAEKIIPLPMPSAIAARYLAEKSIKAELIYIDGSHDEKDVYDDITAYWELLSPGGVMFGDDWSLESVACAVQRFCTERNLTCETKGADWKIEKTKE